MSEILFNQNKELSTGEKVLRNTGVRGLIASDLPASEVISTLSKRVRVAKTQTEKYNYFASKMFGMNRYFDGMLDINYTEMVTGDASDPYSDVVIADFNGETNKAIRFTYEAKTQSNVKTKILDEVLMNFKTMPGDAITAIYKGTENINKSQELFFAKQVWTALADRMTSIEVSGEDVASTGDSVNKLIDETLMKYATTKKTHVGVGTDPVTAPGVIEDAAGNKVSPSLNFSTSDFFLIQAPDFKANTRWDGEKVYYQYNGVEGELAGNYVIDVKDSGTEEIPAEVLAKLSNMKAMLVHKNALIGIQDWQGSGIANAGKLFTIFKNYMKQDVVPVYDAPVLIFETAAAPTMKIKA